MLLAQDDSRLELTLSEPFGRLPLVVSPRQRGLPIGSCVDSLKRTAVEHLDRHGGLLLRGFGVNDIAAFRAVVAGFDETLLSYEFGSTPRSRIDEGVYSSTEYPAHQVIPLHNEQAYSTSWPMKLWFHCVIASSSGGETPIADSREIYSRMRPAIRERFEQRGLMYVRNFGAGLDVPWSQVFQTNERAEVERYCHAHGIGCEWKSDGELRTRQVCQAIAVHPRTRDKVWFNQAHLFHVSGLQPDVREALLEVVAIEDLPRNVYYADGSALEDSLLDEVRAVLEQAKVTFPWEAGDVLLLDNMLSAHGRNPFKGARKIVVAMSEGFDSRAKDNERRTFAPHGTD